MESKKCYLNGLPLTISWPKGGLREFSLFLSLWALAARDDRNSKPQSILGRTTKCVESRSLKASGSIPRRLETGAVLCLSVDANSTQKGGSCHVTLELRKRMQRGESHLLWSLWDTRAPELQLDFRVLAAVSLLLFFYSTNNTV